MRGIHRTLPTTRRTVTRKLLFLARYFGRANEDLLNSAATTNLDTLIFDEMETFEHTKCKPLSIPLAVTANRLILGFGVCSMPAKGLLAAMSRRKYGPRDDHRESTLREMF